MKKIFVLLMLGLVAMGMSISASAQMSNLSFLSFKVKSVKPTSFTSVDGIVTLSLVNSGSKITVTEISGIVYKGETPFMIGSAEDIVIPQGEVTLNLVGHCSLSSMGGVFALIADPTINPEAYNVDIACKIRYKGKEREAEVKQFPLSAFLVK